MNFPIRLDVFLLENQTVSSRSKAQVLIKEKQVYVNDILVVKPSTLIYGKDTVEVKGEGLRYVSRGGLKLEKSIETFKINLKNATCLDIGASTGGFTQCMLENGAKKIYAVDVGHSQLDEKLKNDKRVVNMEKTNIRYMDTSLIENDIDFISVDVSFISLKHIFPIMKKFSQLKEAVVLVKPQFEMESALSNQKALLKNEKKHISILKKVSENALESEFLLNSATFSPIKGNDGNIEYLFHLLKKDDIIEDEFTSFTDIVKTAFYTLK